MAEPTAQAATSSQTTATAPLSANLRGIIAMCLAVGCFSVMDALLKTLSGSYPAMQVASMRGLAALPLVTLYVLWRGEVRGLLKVRWPLHLLRGAINITMLALFAFALRELGLAEAYTLFFIAPLLITALSTVVLGEKVRGAHWVAIVLGLVGVVVALRPSQEAMLSVGALAVLGAATATPSRPLPGACSRAPIRAPAWCSGPRPCWPWAPLPWHCRIGKRWTNPTGRWWRPWGSQASSVNWRSPKPSAMARPRSSRRSSTRPWPGAWAWTGCCGRPYRVPTR